MRRLLSVFPCFLYILCLLCSAQSTAAAPPGQMAPDFSLPATDGKPV